jgi:RimJ/RimL family protein N-acetyltransferase
VITFHQYNHGRDGKCLHSKMPYLLVEDTCGIVAFKDGKQIGAVIFDNFLNNSVQGSIWMESPMLIRHGLLDVAFDFAFNKAKKDYIYCLVSEKNIRSLRLCKKLGGKEKMRIPQGYNDNEDFIVMQIHKYDCMYYQTQKKVA